jgi:hypothetical protein
MPAPPLAPEHVARIAACAAEGLSKRAAEKKTGLAYGTVCRYWPDDAPAAKASKPDPVERERERARQEAERREHVTAVKELAFRRFLERLVAENVPPMPAPREPKPRQARGAHERFPLLTLTDWHFEERVKPDGVMGLNHYDVPTACRRVYRVVQACCDWKRDLEAGRRFSVPELAVALLGDFLTGTLHGLERHSDAPNIVRAALACGDLIALALRDLAAVFARVKVVGVAGNHGRLPDDRKVPTKDPTRSWDYLAYQVARRRLEGVRNVEFFLPESYGVLFEVGGHLCYGAHGNFIPNNLGVVGYGVRRFASSLAANLNAAGKQLRYCYAGHWHQSSAAEFAGVQAFICPSLIGTQEYSFLAGGAVNRPAQQLHIMDKDLGLVSQETLYGEGGANDRYRGTYEVEL